MKMQRNLVALRCLLSLQQMAVVADSFGVNIALHKPATQSSMFKWCLNQCHAEKAVDGSGAVKNTRYSCAHTSHKSRKEIHFPSAWWEVDLGSHHTIGNIQILNSDTEVHRLHDMTIDVFENKDKPRIKQCITHKGPAGKGWINLWCDSPVTGRYVRITKPMNGWNDVLSLCEVEIFEAITSDVPGQCRLFKASGEDEARMTMFILHCASACGTTTGCKGFSIMRKEGRRSLWKRKQITLESGIAFHFG